MSISVNLNMFHFSFTVVIDTVNTSFPVLPFGVM